MYDVLDVCRYIINYGNSKNYCISNLKLQKILYFVQAYFLSFTESKQPCFREEIEAWDFGPVVPEAYREYKRFGSSTIYLNSRYGISESVQVWYGSSKTAKRVEISEEDKEIINKVVDRFAHLAVSYLVSVTHAQDPWKNVYYPYRKAIITKESIREYFAHE